MRKKIRAQGSIELMIIVPFIIFFIYVLFANGVRQEATLVAANVNYSDGISIVRSQANPEVDINSSNYVLMKNNSVAKQTENSTDVDLGITDRTWIKGWGGKVLTNHVDPNVKGFSTLNEDESRFIVAYPVSPFVSVFQK
jgi:hypothetical protein